MVIVDVQKRICDKAWILEMNKIVAHRRITPTNVFGLIEMVLKEKLYNSK
jgi:hypothetical protein